MIEVQSLTRYYGSAVAVDNVSFRVGDNQIVGLLGHNGAGKTTIMRMLSGYLEPSAGSITFDGVGLSEGTLRFKRQLGYLPENLPVYPEMMVADYLEYTATLKGIPKATRYLAVSEALRATDLTDRAVSPIGTLSRGFKQRVGVAQSILGSPRLLILDEPTNGLDPGQTEHMRKLIKRISRSATVILSTHIMQEVDAICDRVLILRGGQLIVDESLRALRQGRTLLLGTDHNPHSLFTLLRTLSVVSSVAHAATGENGLFEIHLHDSDDIKTAANSIARSVINAGAQLSQLRVIERDLDTVFREVNKNGR